MSPLNKILILLYLVLNTNSKPIHYFQEKEHSRSLRYTRPIENLFSQEEKEVNLKHLPVLKNTEVPVSNVETEHLGYFLPRVKNLLTMTETDKAQYIRNLQEDGKNETVNDNVDNSLAIVVGSSVGALLIFFVCFTTVRHSNLRNTLKPKGRGGFIGSLQILSKRQSSGPKLLTQISLPKVGPVAFGLSELDAESEWHIPETKEEKQNKKRKKRKMKRKTRQKKDIIQRDELVSSKNGRLVIESSLNH
eukprot:snap_masked-scaffold_9-processed-gene-2.50-mRNA-1 protein AED:1.00 eAED:1.00 QI:0/-1/0/0/-1/1/1/0/247